MVGVALRVGERGVKCTWLDRGRVRPIVNIYVGLPIIIVSDRLLPVGRSAVIQYLLVLGAEDRYHLRKHCRRVSSRTAISRVQTRRSTYGEGRLNASWSDLNYGTTEGESTLLILNCGAPLAKRR